MPLSASPGFRPDPPIPNAALLAELDAAHCALHARIAELGAITSQPAPSRVEYSAGRMRLSQASIDRRTALGRALRHLAERADPGAAQVLEKVRAADGELIAHSVAHLGQWTAQAVAADWPGYCEASRSMREHMARVATAEAELLRPLLK